MNNRIVGEDIILPRFFGSQNAHPSVVETKNLHFVGRGRRPRRPEVVSVIAAHPSIDGTTIYIYAGRGRRPRRPEEYRGSHKTY